MRKETMSVRTAAVIASWVFSVGIASAATGAGSPHIPFAFVENRGQSSPTVRYVGAGPEFRAWFEDRAVILRRGRTTVKITFEASAAHAAMTPQRVAFAGTAITADNPIGAMANYLYGSDPRRWQTDLPLFGSIHYTGMWPGVELTYRAERGNLKAEYLIAPGADV